MANNEKHKAREIKAAVIRKKGGPFQIETLTLEEPRTDEVLVRIVATGMCHTDMVARDQLYTVPMPVVLGHEGAGIVEQVGAGVKKLKNTKIIQSHGRRDPILHLSQGQALRDALTAAGCEPKYLEFNGYHEIHPAAINATADLLKSLLP